MKPASKKLNGVADFSAVVGITLVAIAFLMFFFDDSSSSRIFLSGVAWIILSPVLKGFSILVQNAEEDIELRKKWDEEPMSHD